MSKRNSNITVMFAMNLTFIFVMIIWTEHVSSLPNKLISNYFHHLGIHAITIVSCGPQESKRTLLKQLISEDFQISYNWRSLFIEPLYRKGAVIDLDCPERDMLFAKINEEKAFGMHTEWLLLNKIESDSEDNKKGEVFNNEAVQLISESYALPGSCVKLVQLYNDSHEAFYFDLYKVSKREPMKYSLDWSGSVDIQLPEELPNCAQRNRSDFGGVTLKSATIIKFPQYFNGFESLEYREYDNWVKMHYPMISLLGNQLNFVMNVTITDFYGWESPNGSFDGLMGLLQREEIDLSATGFFMRQDRMAISEFTAETGFVRTAIIFKQPTLSSVSNIFILPFSQLVWISCACLTVLVGIILTVEYFFSKKIYSYPYKEVHATPADLVTMVLSTVCQQGTELNPLSLPSRITVFLFSLFAFFLYTSYSANIVALLQSSAPVIKTLYDLTKSYLKFKIYVERYNEEYFKEAVDENIINLYELKVKPQGQNAYCSPQEGVKLMRTGKYAFSGETNTIYKFISDTFEEDEKCSLSELKLFTLPVLSIPVIKRSGHRELVTRKLAWQKETGMMSRVESDWLTPKPECGSNGSGFVNVGLADFLPALLVVLYGIAVTIGVFIMEIIFYYRGKFSMNFRKRNNFISVKDF